MPAPFVQCSIAHSMSIMHVYLSAPLSSVSVQPRRIPRAKSARVEARQVDRAGNPVNDQLRHRLAGRWRIQDTPDAMAGGHVDTLHARHEANQRQAILRNG